ncbi:MAG: HlyD family efflux transporter periplasmic adaptor subunit [Burkholderiaceae bacterium]|jgi:adhesin transport system membrane fusion protein|nr:HlyD family efflux transporter periplasmic adaptor subunit [Burkholderiaceae bacterium]
MNFSETRSSAVIWISLLALICFLVWASQAELEQITRAPGQIIASGRTQVIQASDGGVLQALLVKEGDTVERDQVLALLDRQKLHAAYQETRSRELALRATVARLNAEIVGNEPAFPADTEGYPQFRANQLALLQKRRASINEETASLRKLLELAQRELAMTAPLVSTGDVSQADVLKLERQVADLQAQITNRQNKYMQDTQADLSRAEEELAGVQQMLAQRADLLSRTELRAPMRGVVKNIRMTTIGGTLKPTEELMQIVPIENELLVEARIRPTDIAFIHTGQTASVKIDAYDYTLYGWLEGKVSYLSPDTLTEDLKQGEQAYYRLQVRADDKRFARNTKQAIQLQPGMTVTVEIKTGKNTVLRYLAKPIVKTMREAMVEK